MTQEISLARARATVTHPWNPGPPPSSPRPLPIPPQKNPQQWKTRTASKHPSQGTLCDPPPPPHPPLPPRPRHPPNPDSVLGLESALMSESVARAREGCRSGCRNIGRIFRGRRDCQVPNAPGEPPTPPRGSAEGLRESGRRWRFWWVREGGGEEMRGKRGRKKKTGVLKQGPAGRVLMS